MAQPDHIDGWWFSDARVLPHGDDRPIKLGLTHHVDGDIVPCNHGLHLSVNARDALQYATGKIIWRVRGHGTIVVDRDKVACSDRTYLRGGIDVSDILRRFARMCALDVIHLWDAPDIVRKFLHTADAWDYAARDAARAFIGARQNKRLHRMLMNAIRKEERKG